MLRLELLGGVTVTISGAAAPPFRGQTVGWLLALLALRNGRPIERDWLAATLWPESGEEQARYNLRRNLTCLRKILGPEAHRLHSPTTRTLALSLTGAYCDTLAFDAAIVAKNWQEAISHYGGSLLPRCDGVWVIGERERREANYLQALEEIAAQFLTARRWDEAISHLTAVLERSPFRESAVRALMCAFAEAGDRNQALLTYRSLRLRLHQERLGPPDPETTALYHSLAAVPITPAAGNALPAERKSRLPHPLTDLVGRETELERIAELLRRNRWLSLIGMGGIGKTRLALEAARRWPGNVCYVELAALQDPQLLTATVQQAAGAPPEADLRDFLQGADLLLVMDNCEHLLDSVARFSSLLLAACPGVRLLATSREPLGVPGEALYRVFPLQEDAAQELFLQRARAANPDYRADPQAELLCRELEGWPLAIELVASQARSLPLEAILSRVRQITAGRRAVPDRQRSLQATLDWSWQLLQPEERLAFCRLSLLSGGWTLEIAEEVCGATAERLTALVDKSLAEFDGSRYRFREPIRQYATERWDNPEDQATVTQARMRYFLQLARTAEDALAGPEAAEWQERLTIERDNLRGALSFGGPDALRLACALTEFWAISNTFIEGEYWINQLLAGYSLPNTLRSLGLHCAGRLAMCRFDWETARLRTREAMALWRERGDSTGFCMSLYQLGGILSHAGRFEEARETLQQALAIFLETGDRVQEARCRENLGYVARNLGKYSVSESYLREALALYRLQGDAGRCLSVTGQLAMVRRGLGDLAGSRDLLNEVLCRCRQLSRRSAEAWTLCCLGEVEGRLGNLTAAREYITQSLQLFQEAGRNPAWPLLELGRVARKQGEKGEAFNLLQEARKQAVAGGAVDITRKAEIELKELQ